MQNSEQVPENSAAVIDGMVLVQKVKADQLSFGEIALNVLSMALREGMRCNRLHFVFDTYKELYIKISESLLRGKKSGHLLRSITSPTLCVSGGTF